MTKFPLGRKKIPSAAVMVGPLIGIGVATPVVVETLKREELPE